MFATFETAVPLNLMIVEFWHSFMLVGIFATDTFKTPSFQEE